MRLIVRCMVILINASELSILDMVNLGKMRTIFNPKTDILIGFGGKRLNIGRLE